MGTLSQALAKYDFVHRQDSISISEVIHNLYSGTAIWGNWSFVAQDLPFVKDLHAFKNYLCLPSWEL